MASTINFSVTFSKSVVDGSTFVLVRSYSDKYHLYSYEIAETALTRAAHTTVRLGNKYLKFDFGKLEINHSERPCL